VSIGCENKTGCGVTGARPDVYRLTVAGPGFQCCILLLWYSKHQVSQQGSSSWLLILVMQGNDDLMECCSFITGSTFQTVVICVGKSTVKNKDEWKGNSIQFDIIPKSDHTEIKFTQFGLVSSAECYDICENAWNTYLQNSLYQLIESGKGHPNSSEQPQTSDERNLGNANFTTTFFVNQSPELVFNAINQVSSWWQGKITGLSNENGDQFTYQMEDMHLSSQKVTEFIPFKKIAWLVTKSKLSWANEKEEWTGTTIHFEIKEINNKTQLRFTHEGLNPKCECFAECAAAWEKLIQESLYSLITTGKGTRVFG